MAEERTQFTPGPWKVSRYVSGGRHRASIVQDTKPLSRILIEPPTWFLEEDLGCEEHCEFEANLSLIAAAPDLYEALKGILGIARAATLHSGGDHNRKRIAAADAALGKAAPALSARSKKGGAS